MIRFLTSRFTVIAMAVLFALAFGWNTVQGAGQAAAGHSETGLEPAVGLQGLSLQQDLRDLVAHGPGAPPDPWDEIRVA